VGFAIFHALPVDQPADPYFGKNTDFTLDITLVFLKQFMKYQNTSISKVIWKVTFKHKYVLPHLKL